MRLCRRFGNLPRQLQLKAAASSCHHVVYSKAVRSAGRKCAIPSFFFVGVKGSRRHSSVWDGLRVCLWSRPQRRDPAVPTPMLFSGPFLFSFFFCLLSFLVHMCACTSTRCRCRKLQPRREAREHDPSAGIRYFSTFSHRQQTRTSIFNNGSSCPEEDAAVPLVFGSKLAEVHGKFSRLCCSPCWIA